MATANKKATAKALVKAAKNAKSPSKGKEPSAPKKEKGTPKNLMTFYVSAKGTVISGHVTSKNRANPYFEFSIDGNQLQLRWAPKGTTAASLRVLKASLTKNSADELCGRIRGKLSPDLFKILRPIFAWLIEHVKSDTLDQPKVGRCWREMPKANSTAPAAAKLSFLVNYEGTVISKPKVPFLQVDINGNDVEIWNVLRLRKPGYHAKQENLLYLAQIPAAAKRFNRKLLKGAAAEKGQSPDLRSLVTDILDWLAVYFKKDRKAPEAGTTFIASPYEVDAVEHHQEPDCTPPCLKATVKPATENVFSTTEFVQRTKVWQLAQVTWHDALVCRKMLEKHDYDLDAAYAEFLDCAERTARKVSGSDS